MKRFVFVMALAPVLGCIDVDDLADQRAAREKSAKIEPAPKAAPKAAPIVSRSQYMKLQNGMTYDEVFAIIGTHGEEISSNEIAGIRTVMLMWKNWDGSNMNAMFQNGRLVQKAQFGLP